MTEHTPTPWEILKNNCSHDEDDCRGWTICSTDFEDGPWHIAVLDRYCSANDFNGDREMNANAHHIVHCVNNFDKLVEALKEYKHTPITEWQDGDLVYRYPAREALQDIKEPDGKRGGV